MVRSKDQNMIVVYNKVTWYLIFLLRWKSNCITDNDRIQIFDLYKIGSKVEVSIKPFGVFSSNLSIPTPEMWERRANMEGYHLRYDSIIVDFETKNLQGLPFCAKDLTDWLWFM